MVFLSVDYFIVAMIIGTCTNTSILIIATTSAVLIDCYHRNNGNADSTGAIAHVWTATLLCVSTKYNKVRKKMYL